MVDLSALETRQSSPTLHNEDQSSRSSGRPSNSSFGTPDEDMMNHRYCLREEQGSPIPLSDRGTVATVMGGKAARSVSRSRRRRGVDVNRSALQQLDETVASVASIGSRRGGDTSWNDGDSVSQSSQSIATHDGHSQTHRTLIANMRDITDMRGRSLPNPYVVGPRSVSMCSRRSDRSRASRLSRRSNRKRDALERMISLTLLETATSEDGESQFVTMAEDASLGTVMTTEDILNDLVTISTIVEHETRAQREYCSSPLGSVPKNPKPLLPDASGDDPSEASLSYDNVDYAAPRQSAAPVFFKLQKQAHQTISEDDNPRSQHYQHRPSSARRHVSSSPTDPFVNLETRENRRWSTASPVLRTPRDPPAMSPKQLFERTSLTDECFPAATEDTPVGAAVASFFQSQMDAPSEWNPSEWTTFEDTSPFRPGSDASPSSVVDSFIRHAASTDSGFGSKYSI